MKISEIRSGLRERATRVKGPEFLYIYNYLIWKDVRDSFHITYPDELYNTETYTYDGATKEFALPTGYDLFGSIETEQGITLYRAKETSSEDPDPNTYWIAGNKLHLPSNTSLKTGEEIYFNWYGRPEIATAETEDFDFSDDLLNDMYPIYAAAMGFFYFDRNKRYGDRESALQEYATQKAETFTFETMN